MSAWSLLLLEQEVSVISRCRCSRRVLAADRRTRCGCRRFISGWSTFCTSARCGCLLDAAALWVCSSSGAELVVRLDVDHVRDDRGLLVCQGLAARLSVPRVVQTTQQVAGPRAGDAELRHGFSCDSIKPQTSNRVHHARIGTGARLRPTRISQARPSPLLRASLSLPPWVANQPRLPPRLVGARSSWRGGGVCLLCGVWWMTGWRVGRGAAPSGGGRDRARWR